MNPLSLETWKYRQSPPRTIEGVLSEYNSDYGHTYLPVSINLLVHVLYGIVSKRFGIVSSAPRLAGLGSRLVTSLHPHWLAASPHDPTTQ